MVLSVTLHSELKRFKLHLKINFCVAEELSNYIHIFMEVLAVQWLSSLEMDSVKGVQTLDEPACISYGAYSKNGM